MRASDVFGVNSSIGAIVPGLFENDNKYLNCDGISVCDVNPINQFLGYIYPRMSAKTAQGYSRHHVSNTYPFSTIADIAYGNGIYVIACPLGDSGVPNFTSYQAASGMLLSSPDGVNWTPRPVPTALNSTVVWTAVHWTGSHFIAAGVTPDDVTQVAIATSLDGMSWLLASTFIAGQTSSGKPSRIASSGNRFAVVFDNASFTQILVGTFSSGLVSSVSFVNLASGVRDCIEFQGAIVFALNGSIRYTYDFLDYNSVPGLSNNYYGLASNGTTLVATTAANNLTVTITDLTVGGTPRTVISLNYVAHNGTEFLAGGSAGNGNFYRSTDGITWTLATLPATVRFTANATRIKGVNGEFCFYRFNTYPEENVLRTTDMINFSGFIVPPYSAYLGATGAMIHETAYSPELGLYVAVGEIGTNARGLISGPYLATSTDGINWKRIALPINGLNGGNRFLQCVKWNGTRFVATGHSPYAFTSTDGINWQAVSLPSGALQTQNVHGLEYGNGRWVIIYPGSTTYFESLDGLTWNSRRLNVSSQTTTSNPFFLAWNGSTFMAVSGNAEVWTSATGAVDTWVRQTTTAGHNFTALSCIGTQFVGYSALTDQAVTANTATGTAWTARNLNTANTATAYCFVKVGSKIVAIPKANAIPSFNLAESTDGITWTNKPCPVVNSTRGNVNCGVSNGTDLFLLPANGNCYVWHTPDLTDWRPYLYEKNVHSVVAGNLSLSVHAKNNSGVRLLSINSSRTGMVGVLELEEFGVRYNPIYIPNVNSSQPSTSRIDSICSNGDYFVAIGIMRLTSNQWRIHTAKSVDGRIWTDNQVLAFVPPVGSGAAPTIYNCVWTGSQFIAVSSFGHSLTSPDGVNWTVRKLPFLTIGLTGNSLAYCASAGKAVLLIPGTFMGAGSSTYYTVDGINWVRVTNSLFDRVASGQTAMITSNAERFVVCASNNGSATTVFVSTDGINWTESKNPLLAGSQIRLFACADYFVLLTSGNISISKDGKTWSARAWTSSLGAAFTAAENVQNALTLLNVTGHSPAGYVQYEITIDPTKIQAPSLSGVSANQLPFYNYSLVIG